MDHFTTVFAPKLITLFSICDVGMSSISKPDHCAERPSLVLLSAYQEYLMTFKLMTSQVVQRARPLITHICVVGTQRVNLLMIDNFTFNRSRVSQLVTLHVDSKPISVLCHLGDFGCGDGGWTPVMKIDGKKVWYFSGLNS